LGAALPLSGAASAASAPSAGAGLAAPRSTTLTPITSLRFSSRPTAAATSVRISSRLASSEASSTRPTFKRASCGSVRTVCVRERGTAYIVRSSVVLDSDCATEGSAPTAALSMPKPWLAFELVPGMPPAPSGAPPTGVREAVLVTSSSRGSPSSDSETVVDWSVSHSEVTVT
jgi:hypothetical protein